MLLYSSSGDRVRPYKVKKIKKKKKRLVNSSGSYFRLNAPRTVYTQSCLKQEMSMGFIDADVERRILEENWHTGCIAHF